MLLIVSAFPNHKFSFKQKRIYYSVMLWINRSNN